MTINSLQQLRPASNNSSFIKKKQKSDSSSASCSSNPAVQKSDDDVGHSADNDLAPKVRNLKDTHVVNLETNEVENHLSAATFNCELGSKHSVARAYERSGSKDKVEFS